MDKHKKNACTRVSDQNYYLSKILSELFLEKYPNPEYTDEDEKMKLEIFGIPNINTCFITNNDSNGTGDHIYEINGYFKKTNKRGINDKWNLVPVEGKLNKRYKKLKFKMNGKNISRDIGYESLTRDELTFLMSSVNEKYVEMGLIFCKIHAWKMYVKQRGARMCYEEDEDFKKYRENFYERYRNMWEETFREIGINQ